MASILAWFDDDGTTQIDSVTLGTIAPGENYFTRYGDYRQVIVKNVGTTNLTSVAVEIQQVGAYDAYLKSSIATGGSPGAFVDESTDPLALGDLTVGAQANVWIQYAEPGGAAQQQGKLFNLVVTGLS